MLSNHVKTQNEFYSTLRKSDLSQAFSEYFPGISLAEMLSNFSLPVSLGELKEVFSDEVGLHLKPVCCHLLFSLPGNLSPLNHCTDTVSKMYFTYVLGVHCYWIQFTCNHTLVIVSHAAGNPEGCLAGAASADHSGTTDFTRTLLHVSYY